MQNKVSQTLGRKVRLGKLGVPAWSIAVAGLTIAAVAGQAVGPVLSGSVGGSAGLVVSQTVVLDSAPTGSGFDDFAATVNDEGTAFTVALETQVGQNQTVTLDLANRSGKSANVILEVNVPAGIDVDANEGGGAPVSMAQLTKTSYLLTLGAADPDVANNDIVLEIESKDDVAPSFYTISGRIIQVAN